ncbi:MAG: hypothetical protein CI948_856 [Halanaerobium sp.]|jgi:hypothetical protein|nr:MAG: hypothetical protein AWL62_1508 [Halanaerobium sp. T82-1]PUU92082.1 MAG: hypothetical protein CI948_856 [Halanaerobium sp.]PUU93204.1 MAG: hypothetical protein CI949_1403 [Halanaerobium sp.]
MRNVLRILEIPDRENPGSIQLVPNFFLLLKQVLFPQSRIIKYSLIY